MCKKLSEPIIIVIFTYLLNGTVPYTYTLQCIFFEKGYFENYNNNKNNWFQQLKINRIII